MLSAEVKLTEFSNLITRYTADFVRREWLVERVDTLLDDPDCRFVVLTGGPGAGKIALLAHSRAKNDTPSVNPLLHPSRQPGLTTPRQRRDLLACHRWVTGDPLSVLLSP